VSWTRWRTMTSVSRAASRAVQGRHSRTNSSCRSRTSSSRLAICPSVNDWTSPSHSTSPRHRSSRHLDFILAFALKVPCFPPFFSPLFPLAPILSPLLPSILPFPATRTKPVCNSRLHLEKRLSLIDVFGEKYFLIDVCDVKLLELIKCKHFYDLFSAYVFDNSTASFHFTELFLIWVFDNVSVISKLTLVLLIFMVSFVTLILEFPEGTCWTRAAMLLSKIGTFSGSPRGLVWVRTPLIRSQISQTISNFMRAHGITRMQENVQDAAFLSQTSRVPGLPRRILPPLSALNFRLWCRHSAQKWVSSFLKLVIVS